MSAVARALCPHNGRSLQKKNLRSRLVKFLTLECISVYLSLIGLLFGAQVLADEVRQQTTNPAPQQVIAPRAGPVEEKPPKKCKAWHFYAGAEYLSWWWKNSPQPVPVGVTTGTSPAFPAVQPAIEDPGVSRILGGKAVDFGQRQGLRASIDSMLTPFFGMGGSYLLFPEKSMTQSAISNGQTGSESMFVPLNNTNGAGSQGPFVSAFPGLAGGYLTLQMKNSLQNAEGNFFGKVYCEKPIELGIVTGFKWWEFKDKLTFESQFQQLAQPEQYYYTKDQFNARNHFYGWLIGLDAAFTWDWFWCETLGKISLGSMHSTATINGKLITNDFIGMVGTPYEVSPAGGLFALPTNTGKYESSWFAVIPEVNVNFGFQLQEWIALEIGYSFLYVNKVLWSGNTMNSSINPENGAGWLAPNAASFTGPADPQTLLKTEGFWAHGINAGLAILY